MIDVVLPAGRTGSGTVAGFAACLASVCEVTPDELPAPSTQLRSSIGRWRSWLAGRGVGLVPIADARRFNWPGYWIAVIDGAEVDGAPGAGTEDPVAALMFGSPSGVVLSPQQPALLGRAATDLPVRSGYVVATLDPAFVARAELPKLRGEVAALAIADQAAGPMRDLTEASARAGRGLDGDRYAAKRGTFTPTDPSVLGSDLTLVQAEYIDDLRLPGGARLGYADARRNVVTRGIDLNQLVGRVFRVGDAICRGQRLCEPCAHLERLTERGVLRGLIHRAGLRADVIGDGRIEVGSAIETVG